jgi:hypothetical protein
MVELIIVLLKQLLLIPEDPRLMNQGERSLQKRFLSVLVKEHVLELFVFLSQDFEDMLHKKLAMHFLEIQYCIIKNFRAAAVVNAQQAKQDALNALAYEEQAKKRQQHFVRSMRHSKFGFQTQIRKEDGTMASNANLYSANIDIDDLQTPKNGLKQRVGLSKRQSKD